MASAFGVMPGGGVVHGSSQPFRPSLLSCKYYYLFGDGLQVFFYKYSKASICRESRRVFLPMQRGLSVVGLLVCSAVAIHGLLAVALRKVVQLLAYPPCIIRAVHHWSFSHS